MYIYNIEAFLPAQIMDALICIGNITLKGVPFVSVIVQDDNCGKNYKKIEKYLKKCLTFDSVCGIIYERAEFRGLRTSRVRVTHLIIEN